MVENRPIFHRFRAPELSSCTLLSVFMKTQQLTDITYEAIHYSPCFTFKTRWKRSSRISCVVLDLELLYKHTCLGGKKKKHSHPKNLKKKKKSLDNINYLCGNFTIKIFPAFLASGEEHEIFLMIKVRLLLRVLCWNLS